MAETGFTPRDIADLRVAVVDDNAAVRGLVRSVLSAFGCMKVFEAADAEQAIEIVNRDRPDLVICDWKMTPVDGMELVRRIRALPDRRLAVLPIIMLSAYSDAEKVAEARDAGVTEFLAKPFAPDALYKRIQAAIHSPRPFVETGGFAGPDRRRRPDEYAGPERREKVPCPSGANDER